MFIVFALNRRTSTNGTCNFSRIDNSDLHIEFRDPKKDNPNAPLMPGGAIEYML